MFIKDWKKEIFTIPNLLSLFRIILIPVYVTIYLKASTPAHYYIAGGILSVSCLTDLIDGKIARKYNMITNLGKILDPLADKATQFTLILCLTQKIPILWSTVVLFIIKESFQLIAGALTLRKGRMLKGALLSGKVCTTILFITLILMVIIPELPIFAVVAITAVNMLMMLIALFDYMLTYFRKENRFQSL